MVSSFNSSLSSCAAVELAPLKAERRDRPRPKRMLSALNEPCKERPEPVFVGEKAGKTLLNLCAVAVAACSAPFSDEEEKIDGTYRWNVEMHAS